MNRVRYVLVGVVLLMLFIAAGCTGSSTSNGTKTSTGQKASKTATVSIKDFAFNPDSVTISVGGTVTWKNEDSATHKIKGQDFESDNLNSGDSFSQTFDKVGTFDYSCLIHPAMTGKVIVE